jgi:hypothetical protein
LKATHKRVRYATNGTRPDVWGLPGLLAVESGRHEQVLTVSGWSEDSARLLGERGIRETEVLPMTLEEIFVDSVRAARERREEGR